MDEDDKNDIQMVQEPFMPDQKVQEIQYQTQEPAEEPQYKNINTSPSPPAQKVKAKPMAKPQGKVQAKVPPAQYPTEQYPQGQYPPPQGYMPPPQYAGTSTPNKAPPPGMQPNPMNQNAYQNPQQYPPPPQPYYQQPMYAQPPPPPPPAPIINNNNNNNQQQTSVNNTTTVVVAGGGGQSGGIFCKRCNRNTSTVERKTSGLVTWIWCIVITLLTGSICCFIPFCVDSCKDTQLVCGTCLQTKSRISASCC